VLEVNSKEKEIQELKDELFHLYLIDQLLIAKGILLEDAVEEAFNDLKFYWQRNLELFSLKSGDPRLDRMVNIWNQYQCMVTFNFSVKTYVARYTAFDGGLKC